MHDGEAQELRRVGRLGHAAAAARAAYTVLLEAGSIFPTRLQFTLPGGQRPAFSLARHAMTEDPPKLRRQTRETTPM